MTDSPIATDVEQLMERIQHRIDTDPDSRIIMDAIKDCRCYADGICESPTFSKDLISSTKEFIYRSLMRAFKSNFERQRLFNHTLVNTLELLSRRSGHNSNKTDGADDNDNAAMKCHSVSGSPESGQPE